MTMVFDRYPEGGNERLLALAMADHSRDDGTRIFPSLDELARKTLQSRRTVQRQIAKMVSCGWLELVSAATGRPGATNEYRVSAAWIGGAELPRRGVKLTPLSSSGVVHTGDRLTPLKVVETGVRPGGRGVTTGPRGVTAMAPESSEPSRTVSPLPPDGVASGRGNLGFEDFEAAYPKKVGAAAAARRWQRINPSQDLVRTMLAAIAVQAKTQRWLREEGRAIPDPAKWLRNQGWLDDLGGVLPTAWWEDGDGIKAMGAKLGMPFSLAELGNAYTDDERNAHWLAYRSRVLAAAGEGPWSERRAA